MKLEICAGLGLRLGRSILSRWANIGFRTLGNFFVNNGFVTWQKLTHEHRTLSPTLFFCYCQIKHICSSRLAEPNVTSQKIGQAFFIARLRGIGNWYRLLHQCLGLEVISKHINNIGQIAGCSITRPVWDYYNCLSNKAIRAANFKRISFYCKWMLYYTPAKLNKMYHTVESICFRFRSQSGDWLHMIFICPKLKEFWTEIFAEISNWVGRALLPDPMGGLFGIPLAVYYLPIEFVSWHLW